MCERERGVKGEGQKKKKVEWKRGAGPKRGMKEGEIGRKTGQDNPGKRKEGVEVIAPISA